jgi:hypothetical protein
MKVRAALALPLFAGGPAPAEGETLAPDRAVRGYFEYQVADLESLQGRRKEGLAALEQSVQDGMAEPGRRQRGHRPGSPARDPGVEANNRGDAGLWVRCAFPRSS